MSVAGAASAQRAGYRPPVCPSLCPEHRRSLEEGSGLDPATVTARGYFTVTRPEQARQLGFHGCQAAVVPALAVPLYGPTGERAGYQLRPDVPRLREGKKVKYEWPAGRSCVLDVPPVARERVSDPFMPLIVTEGAKKGDALAQAGAAVVTLAGVWNWRGRSASEEGGAPLPDWERIPLDGRDVVVLFDSDGMTNRGVRAAARALAEFLRGRGARVRVLFPRPGPNGEKRGADDALMGCGGDLGRLLKEAQADTGALSGTEPNGAAKPEAASLITDALRTIGGELWHDPEGAPHVTFPARGEGDGAGLVSKRLSDLDFRRWVTMVYYRATGRTLADSRWRDVMSLLEAQARYDGQERRRELRWAHTAATEGGSSVERLWLDLADGTGRVVRVDPDGVELMSHRECPVRFVRGGASLPLAVPDVPATDEDERAALASLGEYVNVGPASLPVVWAFLAGCLMPSGTLPVLAVTAEEGSGKSFALSMLRGLLDPVAGDSRSFPDEGGWGAALNGNAVLAFDNVSKLSGEQSDALCRIASGQAFSQRGKYTDDVERVFLARRPVILNGIGSVVARPDLLSRTVPLSLRRLEGKRREERELRAQLERDRPRLLGTLLKRASRALRCLDHVELEDPPRLVDFARWATAAEGPWERGDFMAAYAPLIEGARGSLLEGEPLVVAMRHWSELLAARHGAEWPWEGTTTALYDGVRGSWSGAGRLPNGVRAFGNALTRLAPSLRSAGWQIEKLENRRNGTVYSIRPPCAA